MSKQRVKWDFVFGGFFLALVFLLIIGAGLWVLNCPKCRVGIQWPDGFMKDLFDHSDMCPPEKPDCFYL